MSELVSEEQVRALVHDELRQEVERLGQIAALHAEMNEARQLAEMERTRDLRELTQAIRELTRALTNRAIVA